MNNITIIREQIKRMRQAHVEPYTVIVSGEVYSRLGKPTMFYGIPVDCDTTMKIGWIVR